MPSPTIPRQPPKAMREQIKNEASAKCWLCNLNGTDVAHIIEKRKLNQFNRYREMGLLEMDNIHAYGNLMFLCPTCHKSLDLPVPAWILLPVDLDSFLMTEERFHQDRKLAAERGEELRRTPPLQGPRCVYMRYQIYKGWVQDNAFLRHRVRWAGSPIAAIVHSAGAMDHERLDSTDHGIPEDVAEKLSRLLYLYGAPAPKAVRPAEITPDVEVIEDPFHDFATTVNGGETSAGEGSVSSDSTSAFTGVYSHFTQASRRCKSEPGDEIDPTSVKTVNSHFTRSSQRRKSEITRQVGPTVGTPVAERPLHQPMSSILRKRKQPESTEQTGEWVTESLKTKRTKFLGDIEVKGVGDEVL